MSFGSGVGGPDFSHCWAGEQLFPKPRADGGINTVIQRGFVNTKNKQARRCVLEGHVQAQLFRGQLADFGDFPSLCPVQGAEVHFAAISQDFRVWQKWTWRLPVILNQRGGSPPGGMKKKQGCVSRHVYLIRPFGVGKQTRWRRRWIRQIP